MKQAILVGSPACCCSGWGRLACLVMLGILLNGCTLLKVAWYRQPTSQTYRLFPQAAISRSAHPFLFPRAVHSRADLDSLRVRDGGGRLVTLADYQRAGHIRAFLVIRRDTLVYERYFGDFTASTSASIFSVSKSVLSVLAGIAQAEGYLRPDQLLTDLIPALQRRTAFANLTVRQLLAMQSGLHFSRKGRGKVSDLFSDEAHYFYTTHLKRDLLKARRAELPGQIWKYKNLEPLLLTWALENATGQSVSAYCEEKLWRRIGTAHDASWSLDQHGGLANTASSFQTTALDLAKLGRLLLQNGMWNGQQVVPAAWVRACTTPDSLWQQPVSRKWQQPVHRNYWWIPQDRPRGDFYAEGMRGQLLYVDRRSQTIIVQLAEAGAGDFPYRKIACYLAGEPFDYPLPIPGIHQPMGKH